MWRELVPVKKKTKKRLLSSHDWAITVAILFNIQTGRWEIDYSRVTSPAYAVHWWASSREQRPAAIVWGRRWVSPSLRCFCLHSSLFPKKRREELGPGRRAAAIIGKLAEIPLSHTQSAHEFTGTRAVSVAVEACLRRKRHGDCNKLSRLSRVRGRPQPFVGQTMARKII